MDAFEKSKSALISGMQGDARAEAAQIVEEAEVKAAEKIKYADQKIKALLDDARAKAAEQAEMVRKKTISGVELEAKRKSLHLQGVVIQDIMKRVEKRLASFTDSEQYKTALVDWIAEAAMSLDCQAATVNASEKERSLLNDEVLAAAAEQVRHKSGRKISLTVSDDQPLKAQGVVVTADDKRTAFNNQVKTRMRRKQPQIQALIYNTIFADSQKE